MMRVVKYEYDALCAMDKIDLGIKGEKLSRRIEISIPSWRAEHESPTVSVIAQDPSGEAYKVETEWTGGTLSWTISERDTKHAGGGMMQITMTDANGAVEKSPRIPTYVMPSLDYEAAT